MPTAHVNVKGRTSMDGSGWAAGLRKMETGTKGAAARMAGSFAGAIGGVFAVGFLASATRRIVQHADQIHKTAKRISASTETVQKFDFAATQSGTNLESVQDAFMDLAKAIQEAKDGAETKRKALLDFGVTMQMLRTARPEEVFLKIAEAIEKAGGAMDKAKSLEELMGGGGRKLVPAFVSGFGSLMGQAPKGIDNETIENLVKFNDELDRLKRETLPAAAAGVSAMADVFNKLRAITSDEWKDIILPPIAGGGKNIGGGSVQPMPPGMRFDRELELMIREALFGGKEGDFFDKSVYGTTESLRQEKAEAQAKYEKWLNRAKAKSPEDTGIFLGSNVGQGPTPIGKATDAAAADAAAAAAARAWSKPSLQLNSLQRIGAAVSQSADPVAIEKDNNQLLKNIAKNTKKTADNITSDEY